MTLARSVARLTDASFTPVMRFRFRSIVVEQLAQVMPVMGRTTWVSDMRMSYRL